MSEFDKLRSALKESLASKDCNKARVLAAKLLVRAKTEGEREIVHEAQQHVATCPIGLSGVSASSRKKKLKKASRRVQQRAKAKKLRRQMEDIKKLELSVNRIDGKPSVEYRPTIVFGRRRKAILSSLEGTFDRSFLTDLDRQGLRRALWLLRRQDARPYERNPAAAQYDKLATTASVQAEYRRRGWKVPKATKAEKSERY